MEIPFLALILQGIPEQIAVTTLAFVIAKMTLRWTRVILIGSVLACASYVLRLFPVIFGIHTVFNIATLFVLLKFIGKGHLNLTLFASLLSYLTLIIIEAIYLLFLLPIFGLSFEMLYSNVLLRIIVTLPQVATIFTVAFLLNHYRKIKAA